MKRLLYLCCLCCCFCGFLFAQKQKSNLPTLYLTTDNAAAITSKETYVSGSLQVIYDADTSGLYNGVMEIRGRGNSTWRMAKKPYRIKLDEKYKMLGMPAKEKAWVLLANYADKTLIRNALAFEISAACGMYYTPAYRYVDVVLNGSFLGNYMLTDQMERNKNRIDVDKLDSTHTTLPDISGGYILEVDGFGITSSIADGAEFPEAFKTSIGDIVTIKYPKDDDILAAQRNYIISHFNTFEKTMMNFNTQTDPFSVIEQYLDVEAFAKWYIATELTANPDCIFSIYMKKLRDDDKMYFGPLWDNDISFGNCNRVYNSANDGRNESIMKVCFSNYNFKTIVQKIIAVPEIQYAIAAQWDSIKPGLKDRLQTFIDSLSTEMEASQALNFQRWNILNSIVYNELAARGSYAAEVAFLKDYMGDRVDFLDTFFTAMADTSGNADDEDEDDDIFRSQKNVGYYLQCLMNGKYLIGEEVNGHWQLGYSTDIRDSQEAAQFYITHEEDSLYYLKNRAANASVYINAARASIPLSKENKTAFSLYVSPNTTLPYFGLVGQSDDSNLNDMGIDANGEVVAWSTANRKSQREYCFIPDTTAFSTTFLSIDSNDPEDVDNWSNGLVNDYTRSLTVAEGAELQLAASDTIQVDSVYIQPGGSIRNYGQITAGRFSMMATDSTAASLENIESGTAHGAKVLIRTFSRPNEWQAIAFPYDVTAISLEKRTVFPLSQYHIMHYNYEMERFDTLSYSKSKKPEAGAYLFQVSKAMAGQPFYFYFDSICSFTEHYDDYVFVGNMSYGKIMIVGDQSLTYRPQDTCFILRKDTDYVEIPAYTSYFTTAVGEALDTIYVYPAPISEPPSGLTVVHEKIAVYSRNGQIVVQGLAEGKWLRVYRPDGLKVTEIRSDGNIMTVPTMGKGIYIIQLNNSIYKLIIN